ncbi:hypothetical protein ACFQZ4_14435 [Catellatospora coxensis]
MLHYKAIYRKDIEDFPDQEAVGLIIAGEGYLEYLIWDHRAQSWRYDPETAGFILGRDTYDYRRRPIDRPEAEQIAMAITNGTDPLPSEEEILEVFRESHRRRAAGTLD